MDSQETSLSASGITATFQVWENDGTGFEAELTLSSVQTSPVKHWRLEFDYPAAIASIEEAVILDHSGDHYVLEGALWNRDLPARRSVSIRFRGQAAEVSAAPANLRLNGAPIALAFPRLSIADASAVRPSSGSAALRFPITLLGASLAPVTVLYSTSDGSALAGLDYVATSGSLTFAPGQKRLFLSIPVLRQDASAVPSSMRVVLSSPVNASLAASGATGTILPALGSDSPDIQFVVTSDWGTGFNAIMTVKNSSSFPWTSWTLAFDFPGKVTSIWDASIYQQSGSRHVIQNVFYDGAVPPGGSVSFGFTGTRSDPSVVPMNTSVRGGHPALDPTRPWWMPSRHP